jgi:hypothetical protein
VTQQPATAERVPQRFRVVVGGVTHWGVCFPTHVAGMDLWNVECNTGGFSRLCPAPDEAIRQIVRRFEAFEWLDNDYGFAAPEAKS